MTFEKDIVIINLLLERLYLGILPFKSERVYITYFTPKSLKYSVTWHGQRICVVLRNGEMEISSANTNYMIVPLVLCGEECSLKPGEVVKKKLVLE